MTLLRLSPNLTQILSRHANLLGFIALSLLMPLSLLPPLVSAAGIERRPPPSKRALAQAEHQYMMRCSRCHGEKGDGNGPLADILEPRPRDFTFGMYKLRTTAAGVLPTDEDLFRTISRGIPGTSMPSWKQLPEQLRWMLVDYIKTFSEDFSDPEYDPYGSIITMPPQVPSSPSSIAKGREIFEKNRCTDCHGQELRGDGKTDLRDEWGYPARVPNLTRGWNFKGGKRPEDIIFRFTTGLDGTAMRSFEENIVGEDRWHLANYLASMAKTGFNQEMIFRAEKKTENIPLDVDADIWSAVAPTKIFVQGQTVVEPLWINNAVDIVNVRAIYNEDERRVNG